MSWIDVGKKIAANGAKLLGGVIAGSTGEKIGSFVASVLGVDNNPDEVLKALDKDPNVAVELKRIETSHREELEKLSIERISIDVENEKAFLEDRQNARKSEVEHVKLTGRSDKNRVALAWVITLGFLTTIYSLFFANVTGSAQDILYILLGTLGAKFSDVVAYYFGSSSGSNEKTRLLNGVKK